MVKRYFFLWTTLPGRGRNMVRIKKWDIFFWQNFRIFARKSVFCYRTPDFVNGPFVALDDIFDLAPSDRFLSVPFILSFGCTLCITIKVESMLITPWRWQEPTMSHWIAKSWRESKYQTSRVQSYWTGEMRWVVFVSRGCNTGGGEVILESRMEVLPTLQHRKESGYSGRWSLGGMEVKRRRSFNFWAEGLNLQQLQPVFGGVHSPSTATSPYLWPGARILNFMQESESESQSSRPYFSKSVVFVVINLQYLIRSRSTRKCSSQRNIPDSENTAF